MADAVVKTLRAATKGAIANEVLAYTADLMRKNEGAITEEEQAYVYKILSFSEFEVEDFYGGLQIFRVNGEPVTGWLLAWLKRVYKKRKAEAERVRQHDVFTWRVMVRQRWITVITRNLISMDLPPKTAPKIAISIMDFYITGKFTALDKYKHLLVSRGKWSFTVRRGQIYFFDKKMAQPSYPLYLALKKCYEESILERMVNP